MSRLAGEVCQGFHVHPFHSVRYLDEVVLENMAEGAAAADRSLDDVEVVSSVFVITGRDESEIEAAKLAVRQQVAFYASTPAYGPVLETHGWEFGRELTAMSKRGEWAEMAGVITDDVLDEVAVEAPVDELGARIRERYGDRVRRVGLYTPVPPQLNDDEWAQLVSSVKG
jgi:probable F420-dependent oxidoreductase